MGDNSPTSVFIFDEIDSLCGKRGGGNRNQVYDSVVTQLLTMIDGYISLYLNLNITLYKCKNNKLRN